MGRVATGAAALFMLAVSLVYIVCEVAYAAWFYPSLFKEGRPTTLAPAAVSFLNLLLGGVIFGCLWNYNLTNRRIGVSHIVFCVLIVLYLVAEFVLVAAALG